MAFSKHLLFCVVLLVGFVLGSSVADDNRGPTIEAPPTPGYNFFKLALQWPNSYCSLSKNIICNTPVPQQFTIRGLWPLKGGGEPAPTCCTTTEQLTDAVITKLKDKLNTYWPRLEGKNDMERGKRLWSGQWRTYGSCSSNRLNPEQYLTRATNLGQNYREKILSELEKAGIKPDGKSYQSSDILGAIQRALIQKNKEFRGDIKCGQDNSKKYQLLEIHLCVKDDGETLQNCQGRAINCGSSGIIFPSTPSQPPAPSPPPSTAFDYFLLTLQWPNALCKEKGITCRPPVPRQYFTIHGLWPSRNQGSMPETCSSDAQMTDAILDDFQCDLLEYWPRLYSADNYEYSKKFWIEEWDKHGKCSPFSPEAYIEKTLALGKKHAPDILTKMTENNIIPDGVTGYTAQKVLPVIKKATKTDVLIRCTSDNTGALQLSDIRICVAKDGITLQDCKQKTPQGNCVGTFIFPSPPSATATHIPFPSFVSSIMEDEDVAEL